MIIPLSDELIDICEAIADQAYTPVQWARFESDDMFQSEQIVGGYDATEKAFTFSYFDSDKKEWWFQLTLKDVNEIADGGYPEIWGGAAR